MACEPWWTRSSTPKSPQGPGDVLLSTSILEHVSAESACELTGDEQAGAILPALAHANAFVQPIGERLVPLPHVVRGDAAPEAQPRASGPDGRSCTGGPPGGMSGTASSPTRCGTPRRPATGSSPPAWSSTRWRSARSSSRGAASPWPASSAGMPHGQAWTGPEPYLVSAAAALSAGRRESCCRRAGCRGRHARAPSRRPGGCGPAGRRGDPPRRCPPHRRPALAAAAAAARAEAMAGTVPKCEVARHPEIRARVLSGRGAVELWSGHLDEAALASSIRVWPPRPPRAGSMSGPPASGVSRWWRSSRGRLRQAAKLAAQATAALTAREQQPPADHPDSAALVARAGAHLERTELREVRSRLTQAPCRPQAPARTSSWSAVACLAAALW